ncbi:MAG: hypothetical protein J6M54_04425 [Prevotella sp.]|nr:hypothetical protein [Prevotella sp.]
MKKLLLTVAVALTMCLTASAQFTNDGVQVWDGNNSVNYGYTVKTNNDGVTYAFFHKVLTGTYPMVLYVVDKDGNILTDEEGLLLSNEPNKSWTVVGQDLTIDVNGNAIVSVLDQRSTSIGQEGDKKTEIYTIYKVGPDGKLIWGNKSLNGGKGFYGSLAGMSICPTSDGGAIFAYMYIGAENGVNIEKLDKDGNTVWTEQLLDPEGMTSYSYPYLVDAGENQAFLFYAEGAGYIIKARLLDMDGSNAWGEDIVCYREGFGGTPLHVQFNVGKGPEGAAFALQTESGYGNFVNRLCYMTKDDGSFAFSDGEGGTTISNDNNNSRQYPAFYWDETAKAFYCTYRVYNQSYQSYVGIYAQKMSEEGELLWGPDGKAVVEIQNANQILRPVISNAPDGKMAVFYQEMAGHGYSGKVLTNLVIVDEDGNMTEPIDVTDNGETKNGLRVSPLINNDHWIVSWNEDLGSERENVFLQWVNVDGTVTKIISETVAKPEKGDNSIYSIDGNRLNTVPNNGIYIQNGKKIAVK